VHENNPPNMEQKIGVLCHMPAKLMQVTPVQLANWTISQPHGGSAASAMTTKDSLLSFKFEA